MVHNDPTSPAARRLVVLGSMSFACVGVAVVLPGALLPLLMERLALRLPEAGLLLAAQPLGHLCAVLLFPSLFAQRNAARTLALAGLGLASAVGAIGWVRAWPGALLAMAASGVSIGALELGTNTVLLIHAARPNRVLNFTHLFFGIASVCTPPLAAWAIRMGALWEWIWLGAAFPVVATGVSWLSLAPFLVRPSGSAGARESASQPRQARAAVLALACAMAAYVGAEIGFGSWYTKYATEVHKASLLAASYGLAAYWGGLTLGRLVLAMWAPGHSGVPFIAGLALCSATAALVTLLAPGATTFLLAAGVLGVALAGIFPGILALAAAWYPADVGQVTGMLLAGAGFGQMLFPWLMSVAAEHIGLARAMGLYPLLCCAVAVCVLIGRSLFAENHVQAEHR